MKGKKLDKKLLQKFKAGECSPEEVRKILLWYQSEEAETSFSIELENYWQENNDLAFLDKDKVRNQVIRKISRKKSAISNDRLPVSDPKILPKQRSFRNRIIIVAIVMLLISLPLWHFRTTMFESTMHQETNINWITKATEYGQRYTFRLSDGTIVKLNSGSRIHYPEIFSDSLRWIEFEGEAFFEIAKDTAKPFLIRSGNIETMVLGTSFNLNSEAAKETFEIAVVTGSVKVLHDLKEQNREERYINPNQSAIWDHQNKTFNVQNYDPAKVLAWTEGILVFDNSTFEDIIFKLEKWYGVKIDTSDLKHNVPRGYTGKYKDKSLETVLQGISYVLDFKYVINGKKVIIK